MRDGNDAMSQEKQDAPEQPIPWHSEPISAVLERLGVDENTGLSVEEARARLERYGPNALPPPRRRGPLLRFLLQFHNPLIYVLIGAALVTFALGDYVDTSVILGVVVINAIIGFIQEGKAESALEAVMAMLALRATVLREGVRMEIDAAELVPGDIVLLEEGSKVPADLRLLRVKNLHANEAPLTGESVPVDKVVEPVEPKAPISERKNMAYSGTVITSGLGTGVVVATGRNTEIGRIGTMVSEVEDVATPLARRLDQFARQLTVLILAIAALTFLYGYFIGHMPAFEIFLAVVGLAVSAIPEGLPAIVTITLAIGTRIMARQRALVRRLPAVETLGSVTVICTDKTGTLTRNEMTAVQVALPGRDLAVSGVGYAPQGGFMQDGQAIEPQRDEALLALARCALLCNEARLRQGEDGNWILLGDPTEGALLTLALKAGLDPAAEAARSPRIDEIPFSSEQRFMATLHRDPQGRAFVMLKGAPEKVLDLCTQDAAGQPLDKPGWERRMREIAAQGQRVLALACRDMPQGVSALTMQDIEPGFTLLGLVGMIDPPRPEAIEAVAQCRRAGIRVVMITGDHALTAAAVGRQIGLRSEEALTGEVIESLDDTGLRQALHQTDVIARASPEHKLRLVSILQGEGELVAMTGDGVNDAPALKAADIGVAMGLRGTDAAKEAADLVLTDDNFATIARAVREGRTVFDNIKKSLVFILPTNGGEGGVILLAVFAGLTLPVTAGQILWVNLVTTVALALALAFEPAEPGVMERPPRPPSQPIVTGLMLGRILFVTLLMMMATFAVFVWQQAHGSLEEARTAAVNMLVFAEMVYLFNTRRFTASGLSADSLHGNPVAFASAAALIALQMLFTYTPPMQQLFHSAPLGAEAWGMILGFSVCIFLAVEVEKWLLRRLGVRYM